MLFYKPDILVFVSYAQRGVPLGIDVVMTKLKAIERKNRNRFNLIPYYDIKLKYGYSFDDQLLSTLNKADFVILLITDEFFESGYIDEKEKVIIKIKAQNREFVLPILLSPSDYFNEWVRPLNLPTIPLASDKTIFEKRGGSRSRVWVNVQKALRETIESIYWRKVRVLVIKIIFILTLLSLLYFLMVKEEKESIGNMTSIEQTPISSKKPSIDYERTKPSQSIKTNKKDSRFVRKTDKYSSDDIGQPSDFVGPCEVPLYLYSYYGKEPYYVYESCQAVDSNGFKPCKKNRRWYIVNEKLGIHKKLNLSVEMHKKIYAIRPFKNGVAQVFLFDNKEMCLSYCLSLDNFTLECNFKN